MINKIKLILATIFTLVGCTLVSVGGHSKVHRVVPTNNVDYAKTSVMIVSEDNKSGGSGVILDSNPAVSHVLTNKHVCQLIQVGGKIVLENGYSHEIDAFRVYTKHDLCLIEINYDLEVNTVIAKSAPELYDTSVVVGHPALFPTIITSGHLTHELPITLIVDMKPCDGTESEDIIMYCIFAGGKPVLRTFQGQITSSLIMPGSSGSPVFNDRGEISGLIFAGKENLGYGVLVPWSYIHDFLTHKNSYPLQKPDPSKKPSNFFTAYFRLENFCKNNSLCKNFQTLGLWHND